MWMGSNRMSDVAINSATQSNVGNLVDLKEGEVLLPDYLLRQQGGVFVDLSLFPVGGGFVQFIDKMFSGASRFKSLNYSLLMELLYDYDKILDEHGVDAKIKLADDVVDFPVRRKSLYKAVKIDSAYQHAEYFFEPVQIEVISEEPVYGEPDADGVFPIIGSARKTELQPTNLDLDEFIADMWLKGVRFGIDVAAVSGVIARRETVRMEVATQLDETEGIDAEVEEASAALHRDNSPKILPNGKADLRRFQNRFPQITAGSRLLKKKPRVLGKPGFRVDGAIIEPEIPKDIDLAALAGSGTRLETQEGFEYILAARDGFLSLDVENNHIAITEKIENKGGISVKTTGDLSLAGDEFIEHGEVQEGRTVEGKNMTFRSDVYGEIVSNGGFILLESNLSNGSARSFGGDVTSNGRAFNSVIEAWEGRITLKYAEACLILGESVLIERAVNCEIIAETVQIVSAEGCAVAAKTVQIKSSAACRGKETVISMVIPDLSILDAQIKQVANAMAAIKKNIELKEREIATIKSDPETAKFLALATSVNQGTVKLTESQMDNWKKMIARFAKINAALERLDADRQDLVNREQAFQQEQTYLQGARASSGNSVRCEIAAVQGETLVRSMVLYNGLSEFRKINLSELKLRLREHGLPKERIFMNENGSLDWRYALPELAQTE